MFDKRLKDRLRETGDTKGFSVSSIFGFYLTRADIRHSHVAHLISLGFTPVEIAERLGHEGISVTYTYSHLYPSKQKELADRLDADHGSGDMLDGLAEEKEGDADENAK